RYSEQCSAGVVFFDHDTEPSRGGAVPVGGRQRLRDCQCEHRDVRCGDRRGFWRGEGDGRRTGERQGCVGGVYAPANEYDQLLTPITTRPGNKVRDLISPFGGKFWGQEGRRVEYSPVGRENNRS